MKFILIFFIVILLLSCEKKEFKADIKTSEDYINEEINEVEKMDNRIKKALDKNNNNFKKENISLDSKKLNNARGLKYDKKYKEALKIYLDLIKTNPKNISIMENIVELASLTNRDKLVKKYCEYILKLDKNNILALQNIATFYASQDKNMTSLAYYEKLLEKSPDYITYQNVGVLYARSHNYDKAIELLKKSIKLNDNTNNNYQLALIYKNINDLNNYVKYLEKSISKKKPILDSYLLLGKAYIDKKNYSKAIEKLEKLIKLKNDNTANKLLAYAYQSDKRYNNAIKYYNKYLEQKPNDMEMLYNLAISYYSLRKYDKFKSLAEKYQKNPKSMVNSRHLKVLLGKIK